MKTQGAQPYLNRFLFALAGVTALTACTAQPAAVPTPAPVTVTATTTVTPSANPGTALSSLDVVRQSLVKAGMPCDGWQSSMAQSGNCSQLVVVTFLPVQPTDNERAFFMAAFNLSWTTIQASDQPVSLLVGDNWMVRMHKDDAAIIQKAMGGIILTRK